MKTENLQQEFITDEFDDCVKLASKILGYECSDTQMTGDAAKGDSGTKFQILPDPYSASTIEERENLTAFESYFYANFGKWRGRSYFDTPSQAFFHLIKAWDIWSKDLTPEIKRSYLK